MSDAPMACPSDRQTDQDGGREANRNQARTCQPQRLAQPTTSRPRRCTQNTRTAQHDTRESSRITRITRITNNQRSSSILLSRRNASERQPDSQTASQKRETGYEARLPRFLFLFLYHFHFHFLLFLSLSFSFVSAKNPAELQS